MTALKPDPRRRPSKFNLALGARIHDVSTRLGVSARQLSLRSGIRLDHLRVYENGLRPPTCRALQRIAQGLGTSVDALLPEMTLDDPVNNAIYRGLRQVWFLPLEARSFLAGILSYLLTSSDNNPLIRPRTPVSAGGAHAPRG